MDNEQWMMNNEWWTINDEQWMKTRMMNNK